MSDAGRVMGIGGVFFKAPDVRKTKKWYADVLGIHEDEPGYGFVFPYSNDSYGEHAYGVLGVFKDTNDYFKPSEKDFMINFRVDDLDALLAKIKEHDIEIEGPVEEEGCGRFAWIVDLNGIKLELWQQ